MNAEEYLRARCAVDPALWDRFDEEEREAFVAAGERLRREEAALVALALRSDRIMRAMLDGEDPLDAAISEGVSRLADRISSGLGGGE